jgi:hypothetical protein
MWRLPVDFWTAIDKFQSTQSTLSPPSSLQRTKLNKVDEHIQGILVTQVAEIRHHTCLIKTAGPASPRVEPQIRHSTVGPLP